MASPTESVTVKSAADAQLLVKLAHAYSYQPTMRTDLAQTITSSNWGLVNDAGYLEFLMKQVDELTDGKVLNDGYPAWYPLAFEIGNSLRAIAGIAKGRDTNTSDILSKLRAAIVNKLLKSILSPAGGVGLPMLAKNGGTHWSLAAAVMLSLGMWESLRVHKDREYLKLYCSSGGIGVAMISWHFSEGALRKLAPAAFGFFLQITGSEVLIAQCVTRYIPAEEIAEKIKYKIRAHTTAEKGDEEMRTTEVLIVVMLSHPSCRAELGNVLRNEGVCSIFFQLAKRVANEEKVDWSLIEMIITSLIVYFRKDTYDMPLIIEFIEHRGMLKFLAQVFLDETFVDGSGCFTFLLEVLLSCMALDSTHLEAYKDVLKNTLLEDEFWCTTFVKMDKMVIEENGQKKASQEKIVNQWYHLGRAVGLEIEAEGDNEGGNGEAIQAIKHEKISC